MNIESWLVFFFGIPLLDYYIIPTILGSIIPYNVGIAIINHPPFITIFMGGISTIKNKGGANDIATYPH